MARTLASKTFRKLPMKNAIFSQLDTAPLPHLVRFAGIFSNLSVQKHSHSFPSETGQFRLARCYGIPACELGDTGTEDVKCANGSAAATVSDQNDKEKNKRKKLKGKRAVVRWLKFFRWKKKKEYQRMTAEEKILYKLTKSKRKEVRLVEALKKLEPSDSSEPTHDPEILTPEEHFYYLKMGHKCKNYVPIGVRGISRGVILNMHLHWKKHQTLKVIVKTFSPGEVKELAAELARLSGGIVLDIHEGNTIIMYRGKNYCQPPTEIMSPKIALSKRKALEKSKIRDALRAVRIYIPRLEQELELLQSQDARVENEGITSREDQSTCNIDIKELSESHFENSDELGGMSGDAAGSAIENSSTDDSVRTSDSESLSDIFETDFDETEERREQHVYLDAINRVPVVDDDDPDDFMEHLRQISLKSAKAHSSENDAEQSEFDEVDRLFLRASSLLRRKRR